MSDQPEESQPEKPAGRPALGAESREMIYRGCSVAQLAEIFGMRDTTVYQRIAGVEPSGTGRGGALIYRISDVAPRLIRVPVTEDMVRSHISKMRPHELPPALHKSYWDGALARHRYAEKSGEMWATEDVQAVASQVFQTLRQGLLSVPDTLRAEIDLTDEQTNAVRRYIDDLIEELRERLVTDLRADAGERSGGTQPALGQA